METEEYYGGTYPSPPEKKEKHIKALVTQTFEIETIVPDNWNYDEIYDDLMCQAGIYSKRKNEEILEIDWSVENE